MCDKRKHIKRKKRIQKLIDRRALLRFVLFWRQLLLSCVVTYLSKYLIYINFQGKRRSFVFWEKVKFHKMTSRLLDGQFLASTCSSRLILHETKSYEKRISTFLSTSFKWVRFNKFSMAGRIGIWNIFLSFVEGSIRSQMGSIWSLFRSSTSILLW